MFSKKMIVGLISMIICLCSEESRGITYWSPEIEYNTDDIVLYQGVRYMALYENKNFSPKYVIDTMNYDVDTIYAVVDTIDNIVSTILDTRDYQSWGRLIPKKELPLETSTRFFPRAHRSIRNLLKEDPHVRAVAADCNFDLIDIQQVALLKEAGRVGDYLHSGWAEFMVRASDVGLPGTILDTNNFNREYINYSEKDGRSRRFLLEQIVHNIGDAGVGYRHALSSYSPNESRERTNEQYGREILKSASGAEDLSRTVFTGTIYDAIIEYTVRTKEALDWVDTTTMCAGYDIDDIDMDDIDDDPENFFARLLCRDRLYNILVKGDKDAGDPAWGVTRNALAVGRNIMIDALLAEIPLQDVKILGNPILGIKLDTTYKFKAFAKDPDAVKIELKPNADSATAAITDYQVQWYEDAHPMYYKWHISTDDTTYANISTSKEINITIVGTDSALVMNKAYNGILTLKISDVDTIRIKVNESRFTLAVKITDDEGTSSDVSKEIIIGSTTPHPVFTLKKENNKNPYIIVVNSLDFSPYTQDNGMLVSSGYMDSTCYAPLYLDAFAFSTDGDGNASDQIVRASYNFDNDSLYEWDILGTNKSYDVFENEVLIEERIVLNNTLCFETMPRDSIKSSTVQHHVSTYWHNETSPRMASIIYGISPSETYSFNGKIEDNEGTLVETVLGAVEGPQKAILCPILTPPVIESVSFQIMRLIEDTTYTQESVELFLGGKDTVISFSASAYDPDNGSTNNNVVKYEWLIVKKDSCSLGTVQNANWGDAESSGDYTYRELIDSGYVPEVSYDVFLKVTDDDGRLTKKDSTDSIGFPGITITKAGTFSLREPTPGDVNLDGFVNEYDLKIINENMGKPSPGLQYISSSKYLLKWVYGDLNLDGNITEADLNIYNFQKSQE